MMKFLAGVLSVIAAGLLLIAYGLLSPRVGAFGSPAHFNQVARPLPVSDSMLLRDNRDNLDTSRDAYGDRYVTPMPVYGYNDPAPQVEARPVRTVVTSPAPPRTRDVVAPERSWKKTAIVIGASTVGGAGVGAIFGGKKGALIGAAVGGGAGAIYDATKRNGVED